MLKRVFLLSILTVMLSVSGAALGDTARNITVVSEGDGSTLEAAKAEAVRRALQQAFKQLVVVDRVVSGDHLLRDRVLSTSNGYVEKYEEISSARDGDGFRVEARITLSASRIENFLGIVAGGSGEMDGSLFSAEISRRNAADAAVTAQGIARGEIFDRMFENYPMGAVSVSLTKSSLSDPDGKTLELQLKLSHKESFIRSLLQTLDALSVQSCTFEDRDGSLYPLGKSGCLDSDIDTAHFMKTHLPQSSLFVSYGSACIHDPKTMGSQSKCFILDHGAYFWSGRETNTPEARYEGNSRAGGFPTFVVFGRFEDKSGNSAMVDGSRCIQLDLGYYSDRAAQRALGIVELASVGYRYKKPAGSGGLRGPYYGRGALEPALGLTFATNYVTAYVPASSVHLNQAKTFVAVAVALDGRTRRKTIRRGHEAASPLKALGITATIDQAMDPCALVDEASLRLRAESKVQGSSEASEEGQLRVEREGEGKDLPAANREQQTHAKLEQILGTLPVEFVGESSGRRQRWPMRLKISSHDRNSGKVGGEVEWPTLDAVHRVEGSLANGALEFREVAFVRKGRASLNCAYKLQPEGNHALVGNRGCQGSSDHGSTRLEWR